VKNQILNVKSYQQVVQFAAELVAHDARKQWCSLPRTPWYSLPRNEWYSLTRILQSVYLIEELFRLAAIYRTCIVCVLHLSPSGYKLRGHLGSEIQRKAAGIISIEKDDDKQNSIVKALKVRDGSPLDIPQVIIGWDDELKYHVLLPDSYRTKGQERKISDLADIARDIFHGTSTVTYTHLVAELKERLGVKDRQAKNYIKTMKENKIIWQLEGDSGHYSFDLQDRLDTF